MVILIFSNYKQIKVILLKLLKKNPLIQTPFLFYIYNIIVIISCSTLNKIEYYEG